MLHYFRWQQSSFRLFIVVFFLQLFFLGSSQNKVIIQGRDKSTDTIFVQTGDKYYDSGGPGGSRLPDQAGNYFNCSDPFNESANCTSRFTFCSSGDTVGLNFIDYLIVTGDLLKIYSGNDASGSLLYDSQKQGVSINGMRLTTGSLLKSKAPDGCITVEWFCTTIGNSIGWDADFIIYQKSGSQNECTPQCKNDVNINLPSDTCFANIGLTDFLSKPLENCAFQLKLYYPSGSDDLGNHAVNMSHLGNKFLFQVSDSITNSSCVGYIKVNESNALIPDCRTDTVTCFDWEHVYSKITKVSTCMGNGFTVKKQTFQSFDCNSSFVGFITRELEIDFTDGHTELCTDTFFIQKAALDSLQCPSDLKFNCKDLKLNLTAKELTPEYLSSLFDQDGDNRMDGTGKRITPELKNFKIEDSSSFCGISIDYSDVVIPGCGNNFKIRRQWMIKSACIGTESVCIQNLSIEDLDPPLLTNMLPLNYQIPINECSVKIVLDSIGDLQDCNRITQKVELSYVDPSHSSKQIVINNALPVTLSLPAGSYTLKYTFSDPCFNVSYQSQCLWIQDQNKPSFTIDPKIQAFVDPGTCWSRIYAADFAKSISPTCSRKYFLTIAQQDSVEYYKKYWSDLLVANCTTSPMNEWINDWLYTYQFHDYVDLLPCQSDKVILSILDITDLPVKDISFKCSMQKWIAYHTNTRFRIQMNESGDCSTPYPILCFDEFNNVLKKGNSKFLFPSDTFLNTGSCSADFLLHQLIDSKPNITDTAISIQVIDSFKPSLPTLPDLITYSTVAESTSMACCKDSHCLGEAYPINSWPKDLNILIDSNHFPRYFGGPVNNNAVYNASGYYDYPGCNYYDSISYLRPIYCKSGLIPSQPQLSIADSIFNRVDFDKSNLTAVKVNCSNFWKLSFKDSLIKNSNCLADTTIRFWELKDNCQHSYAFHQNLIFKRRSEFEVLFPEDKKIDCSAKLLKDSSAIRNLFGFPIIKSSNADCIEVSYKDVFISQTTGEYCLLTERIWQVIDHAARDSFQNRTEFIINDSIVANRTDRYCTYRNLKDGGDGIINYRQIIKYIDIVPPIISNRDTVIKSTNCAAPKFDFITLVHDDCTPDEVLNAYYDLDLLSDGKYDENLQRDSNVIHLPAGLPPGTHTLRTVSADLCGNVDTAYNTITIVDDGAPNIACIQSAVLIPLPSSKFVQVFAKDFDAGSLAGCDQGPLLFSFSENTFDSLRIYTCDSVGIKNINIWITNVSGLKSNCNINLQITADGSLCMDTSKLITVSGKISTSNLAGIKNVEIECTEQAKSAISDIQGKYLFGQIDPGQQLSLFADKKDDPINGLSAVDLLIIEKHIKGITLITDPYLLIAADVNKSGSVTVTDLVELRKMILGSITSFSNNKDWVFIPEKYKFNNVLAPWDFPESIVFNPINHTVEDADFIGIKIGDVNNSAELGLIHLEKRNNTPVPLNIVKDNNASIPEYKVYLEKNIDDAQALQLSIQLPESYLLNSGIQQLKDLFSYYSNGFLNIVWTSSSPVYLNSEWPLFTFQVSDPASFRQFVLSDKKESFIYFNQEEFPLELLLLDQNQYKISYYPNPSKDLVNLRFYVNELQRTNIALTNITGKSINYNFSDIKQGWNHILLNKNDLGGSGEYIFSLRDDKYIKFVKFIML